MEKNKLSEDEFLKLKLNWLVKNNKNNLIEKFLNNNLEFNGKSKLIKHLVDYYIALADIKGSCEKDKHQKEVEFPYRPAYVCHKCNFGQWSAH